ncbi:MAG: ATP-binding protein [Clostridia bacterium]|nr:ATP-binding protein [Clostridia bacterium]
MNKSLLNDLLKNYEQIRIDNSKRLENRKMDLYKKEPRLQEIADEINSSSISIAKNILKTNNSNEIEKLQNNIKNLNEEKMLILKKLGKTPDYLSNIYTCRNCKDTGYILEKDFKTSMCNCLKQKLYNLEYNKSSLSNIEKQNFNYFNENLYSDIVDEKKYSSPISPRENILDIKTATEQFINNFDNPEEKNLIFSGGTGLGKTFLSNCIVNELLKKGKTVMYQTAPVMLDSLISDLFAKPGEQKNLSENLLSVDLLVIDDLGTETINSMKFTELYKIINTRLLSQNGKITKTIISTNLDLKSLLKTYDERIISRFVGYYNVYRFYGDDIRFKIK